MDSETKVFVTNIIDPVNFWARIGTGSQLEKVSDLVDAVNCYGTTVSETSSSTAVLSPVVKDQRVIAKSSTGQWLNAIVLSANRHSDVTDEVDVIYIDFGTTEFVPREYLITTLPEMMLNAVGSARHWQLDGIAPLNETWSPAAIARFSELVMTKTLSATLVGNDDASISGCNSYNAVKIFVPDPRQLTSSSLRSVADILVDEGFARKLTQSAYIPSSPVTPPISLSVIPQFDIERITGVSPESSPPPAVVDFEQEAFLQGVDLSYRCEPYTDLDILNRHVPVDPHDPFDSIRSLVNDATAAHYRSGRSAADRPERSDASQSTRRTKSTKEVSHSSHRREYYPAESTHHGDVHKENSVKANKKLPPRLAKTRENSNCNLLVNGRNRNRPKADIGDESSCRPQSNDVPCENVKSSTHNSDYNDRDERKSYTVDRCIQPVLDDYNRVPLGSLVLRLERCIDDFDRTSHNEYANKTSSFYIGLDCILQHAVTNCDFRNSAREILVHFHDRRHFADYMNQITTKLFSQHVKVRNNERQERLCQNCCELAAVVYIVACAWDDCNELCSTIRGQVKKWAIFDRKGQNASTVGVLFLYSKCLKYFVSVCAKHSVDFLVEHFSDILDEATEKLMSASMPRSIKENMFQMLTNVEVEKRLQQGISARTRTDVETQTTLKEPTVRQDAFCQTTLDTSQSLSFSSYAKQFPVHKPPKPSNFEADFPPLTATATDRDHECTEPSVVVKIPKKFRFPRRSSGSSSRTSVELSPEPCALNDLVAEIETCEKSVVKERPSSANDVYINGACHGDGHWRQVPRKADSSPTDTVDTTVTAHRFDGSLAGKLTSSSLSTTTVLGDFLQECADGGHSESVSKPDDDDDDVSFTPMLVCTICGDRTHTIRTCDRRSGQLFFADEEFYG